METNIACTVNLQHLLDREKAARKEAEDTLARKELEWEAILKSHAQEKEKNLTNEAEHKEAQWGEKLFSDVVNNLPGIVFQVQKNDAGLFMINFVSPILHQILDVEITDTNQLLPFIHPDDRDKWVDSLENTYKMVKAWKLEIRFLMPNDMVYWWICSASPSYSPSNELVYNGILLNITRQKEAELSLKESEKKWRFALEGSGDGLWEYNALTHQTFYSPISKHLLGFEGEEYAKNPSIWLKRVHPNDLPKVLNVLSFYDSIDFESHSLQYRALNKVGEYEWIMDRGVVVSRDVNGKPTHYLGVHTNINKIKQTELELISTATKLATLVTNMQDAILLEDEHNMAVLCNQAFCDIFQLPILPKNMNGVNVLQSLMHDAHLFIDFDDFLLHRQSLMKTCKPAVNEEIRLANGKYLSRDYAPLIIEGECKGHLWKYTDITQRIKDKNRLIEAEKQYRGLIENMEVGLIEYDKFQHILFANHTFYQMCGYTKEEIDGNIFKLLQSNPQLAARKKELKEQEQGVCDAYEAEITTKDGEKRWWYISVVPRQNDQMDTIAVIGACLDITKQKKLEYELRQAKQLAEQSSNAKDIFLANMSHEIRTPMNAMFGMTRLMEKTSLLPQQRFYLETIINSTSSLMVVVNDILDFSKISAGKLSLERIGFRIEDVISGSIGLVKHEAQQKGLELILNNFKSFNNVLLGDPFRLKQVFMNILTNAIKFTNKGSIVVNCYNNGLFNGLRCLNIQVADTGKGMEEDFLKILFDQFTQEDESIARSYSGTGLGMSISKHLVEMMGGSVSVESVKSVGTKFNLNFYFEEGKQADLLVEEGAKIDISLLQNKRILVVEDNAMNQLVVQTVLEQNGMKVVVAINGLEAVDLANETDFDLVLMDMQMPVMDGLQATAIIRKRYKNLPIIALTANALKGERDKCLVVGMNDFLAKPFEEKVLLSLLCKWLDKKSTVVYAMPPVMEIALVSEKKHPLYPLYDLGQLRAISPGNTEFLKMLVKMFVDDATITMVKLNAALAKNDFKAIKSLIHRIKPSIDQLDIPYAVEVRRIEELCIKEDGSGELQKLLIGFDKILSELIPLLEKET